MAIQSRYLMVWFTKILILGSINWYEFQVIRTFSYGCLNKTVYSKKFFISTSANSGIFIPYRSKVLIMGCLCLLEIHVTLDMEILSTMR